MRHLNVDNIRVCQMCGWSFDLVETVEIDPLYTEVKTWYVHQTIHPCVVCGAGRNVLAVLAGKCHRC